MVLKQQIYRNGIILSKNVNFQKLYRLWGRSENGSLCLHEMLGLILFGMRPVSSFQSSYLPQLSVIIQNYRVNLGRI